MQTLRDQEVLYTNCPTERQQSRFAMENNWKVRFVAEINENRYMIAT